MLNIGGFLQWMKFAPLGDKQQQHKIRKRLLDTTTVKSGEF